MFTKDKLKLLAVDTFYDVIGSIFYALGIYTFALNASFAPGGVSGLSLIVNHLFGFPVGITSLALNIPIVIVSYKVLGKFFLFKSLKTMVINTFFIDIVFPHLPVYTGNPFIASIFTGVSVGAGLALIYMRGSSTGGVDFLTLSIKKKFPHFTMGQLTLVVDGVVICLGGIVYGNVDALLYGIIATFASTQIMDSIMYGAGSGKLVIIISDYGMEIAKAIDKAVDRGSTLINAVGTYSGEKRDMLLCACSKNEVFKVRAAAHSVDDKALVVITESNEVFGEGFKDLDYEK